mmetsp:Transcript_23590/g.65473  ORF Transcript_23590/g.65473 Transcript_23590/m.65473 type:complete len:344 (+) Transcript_23590:53-1084(+)
MMPSVPDMMNIPLPLTSSENDFDKSSSLHVLCPRSLNAEKRKDRTPSPPSFSVSPLKKSPKFSTKKSPSSPPRENRTNSQTPKIGKEQKRSGSERSLRKSRKNRAQRSPGNVCDIRDESSSNSSGFVSILSEAHPKTEESPRTVSFNRRVKIRKIPLLENTPLEDIAAKYYSETDLAVIHRELRRQIQCLVEQGVDVDDRRDECSTIYSNECNTADNSTIDSIDQCPDGQVEPYYWDYFDDSDLFCMRGLEQEFPRGKARRRMNKNTSRSAVREEQIVQRVQRELQGECGCSNVVPLEDPDAAISYAYRKAVRPAVEHALETARMDALVAEDIYAADLFDGEE